MQIMRYFPRTETTEDYKNTEIVHADKDSEDQVTVYTNGEEFYITFSKKDIEYLQRVLSGPTADVIQDVQTMKREQGDFS